VAEIRPFRELIHAQEQELNMDTLPHGRHVAEFCAYNQTGQRFISNQVEVPPVSTASFESLLSRLTPDSASAIWIVPIRALTATGFRLPVDLLYLDEDCVVLEAVNSFPLTRVSMPTAKAASILALPARTILSTGTEAGDRLLVCSPDVMQRYLLNAPAPSVETEHKPQLVPVRRATTDTRGSVDESQYALNTDILVRQVEEHIQERLFPTEIPTAPTLPPLSPERAYPPESEPATAEPPAPTYRIPDNRKWWQKLLSDEPADPRKAHREALKGLVAYFFTGGRPVPYAVRDISASGLFVFTSESWYQGTVVRMTLTDERQRTAERSITLHAKVVRCTGDGFGLQFLFPQKRNGRYDSAHALVDLTGSASAEQLEQFMERLKYDS
jgi:hypothetical protein